MQLQAHPLAVDGRVGQREVHHRPLLLQRNPIPRHGTPQTVSLQALNYSITTSTEFMAGTKMMGHQ